MTNDYLLGNAALHARFFATTEILAKLVSRAPRAVSISQLESETGRAPRELVKLCHALQRAGMLCQDEQCDEKWRLAGEPSAVTLEDVFRCIVEQQTPARSASRAASDSAGSEVDLLLMQAMIAINQSVSAQLRRFSLDRIKASTSAACPLPRREGRAGRTNTHAFDDIDETALTSRKAVPDSPVHAAA